MNIATVLVIVAVFVVSFALGYVSGRDDEREGIA